MGDGPRVSWRDERDSLVGESHKWSRMLGYGSRSRDRYAGALRAESRDEMNGCWRKGNVQAACPSVAVGWSTLEETTGRLRCTPGESNQWSSGVTDGADRDLR